MSRRTPSATAAVDREVLRLLLAGASNEEIAERTGYRRSGVSHSMIRLSARMGCPKGMEFRRFLLREVSAYKPDELVAVLA